MNRCVTTGLAAILGLAASACSGSGELGHGTFHYVCTTDHDFSCDTAGRLDFEGALAVGATFDLEYLRSSSDIAARQTFAGVHPASSLVAERVSSTTESGMRFKVPGEGAFLARSLDDDVIDFIHLFATEVVDVELDTPNASFDGMGMALGETTSITAYPLGVGGEHLIGSMTCTWSSDDANVVTMPAGKQSCTINIDALAAGSTTLRVEMSQGASAAITITVEPQS